MRDDERKAIKIKGELKHAQRHEVAIERDATTEIEESDRSRLEAALEAAGEKLQEVQLEDDQRAIDKAEEAYEKAAADLYRFERGELDGSIAESESTSLHHALSFDEWQDRKLDAADMAARLEAWEAFCRYVFQDGIANPWQAFKNFLAAVRRVKPQYLDSITQTELAIILNETKASPSIREKKVVEALMIRFKMLGFHLLGGTKSEEARQNCSIAQMGNNNRSKAKKGKKR